MSLSDNPNDLIIGGTKEYTNITYVSYKDFVENKLVQVVSPQVIREWCLKTADQFMKGDPANVMAAFDIPDSEAASILRRSYEVKPIGVKDDNEKKVVIVECKLTIFPLKQIV